MIWKDSIFVKFFTTLCILRNVWVHSWRKIKVGNKGPSQWLSPSPKRLCGWTAYFSFMLKYCWKVVSRWEWWKWLFHVMIPNWYIVLPVYFRSQMRSSVSQYFQLYSLPQLHHHLFSISYHPVFCASSYSSLVVMLFVIQTFHRCFPGNFTLKLLSLTV